ncbi:MAG: glycerol-3-phosphate acyltransferase [Clostridia bacterium]|nr:glycerol-3-phosphate acyltransferase [Clostridia bacterium]
MPLILLCILSAISAYLLGGVNGAIIVSGLVYHEDIRQLGSGNPGFTNFKRIHGFCPATFAAMAIDIFKTIIPVVTFRLVFGACGYSAQLGAVFTLLFCMIGHCFPVWYGFKGGKAVLAYLSGIWFVDWRMGLICFALFVVILLTIRYMSLASMTFAFTSPIVLAVLGCDGWEVILTSIILSALVIARHWQNIVRLCKGTESKFTLRSKKS